ncbi:MAG: alpha-glucosidase C-terminal domain-containing protein, partial [Thermoplasmata archaeon]|nr:alpha-glucosidase C-terminal domain-containing protein [Thermoplasmata archaeon]
ELVKIKRESHALQSSNIEDALVSPKIKGVIAYNRWEQNESITVVVNVNDEPVNCRLKTGFKGERIEVYDVLSGEKFEGDPENLEVEVPAYTPRILVEERPVEVGIRKPKEKHLYIFDTEVMPFFDTVIVGKITVEVDAGDGIERVEFYVDDVLKFTDCNEPYSWLWNEFAIGRHMIKAVAYDNEGNRTEDKIKIIIFNLGG